MSDPREFQSRPLDRFLEKRPPLDCLGQWDETVHDAFLLSGRLDTPAEKAWLKETFLALRQRACADLVAFHDELMVTPYGGTDVVCPEGYSPWRVEFGLSLFPKREQGFARFECVVEFSLYETCPDAFRVLEVLPEASAQVKACAEQRGSLQLESLRQARLVLPMPKARRAAEVAVEFYGKPGPRPSLHDAVRTCVKAEALGDTAACWRLDASAPSRVPGAESHSLAVILAVRPDAPAIQAAGSLLAYSQENWLDAVVGDHWRKFLSSVREFQGSGAPAEAYGEWMDILVPPSTGTRVAAE
ncbi:hypothetical protein FJV41_15125 [Myxococcus llanfairpwllgwyngyllgogerychwyrndrobwllllantysiliogogogochensis]|uniref:Uncharacterized protein n=1 Tax=Myxococcus llanfairpwllgwyngyllgogerychwyrndrobwllllantysiliogogogochensis TaxID=2590453 RepID=A0A540X1J6_9BACT|nr:hypothetical protein [Myxococcus llanfairpwllgwyngyllgogerychwyrndrobwllllantysiliogogogochensis]TQF15142.1 hypothetical protein FJV41_15125 [Myxococcus llanfairpwllgwyngyllgogerychwyrndrobwllllantysiliogogogochensis]